MHAGIRFRIADVEIFLPTFLRNRINRPDDHRTESPAGCRMVLPVLEIDVIPGKQESGAGQSATRDSIPQEISAASPFSPWPQRTPCSAAAAASLSRSRAHDPAVTFRRARECTRAGPLQRDQSSPAPRSGAFCTASRVPYSILALLIASIQPGSIMPAQAKTLRPLGGRVESPPRDSGCIFCVSPRALFFPARPTYIS